MVTLISKHPATQVNKEEPQIYLKRVSQKTWHNKDPYNCNYPMVMSVEYTSNIIFQWKCLGLHLGENFSRDGKETNEQNVNKKVLQTFNQQSFYCIRNVLDLKKEMPNVILTFVFQKSGLFFHQFCDVKIFFLNCRI